MVLTSIVTVNYKQTAVTIALLKSIAKFYTAKQVEVILVDNEASENNAHLFEPYFDHLTYIQSEKNLGFAGGNNLGLAQAKGQYIFMLNNDTEITENCIEIMIELFEANENIGLLSPLICYYDQKDLVQYAGFTPINYITCRNENVGKFELNRGQFNKNYETGYCHGAAMMCRKADLKKAGLMDEGYFLYYEELDWCEKFKRTGKQIWFTGKTTIYHKESISVGKESALKTYFNVRNRMLFIRKNTNLLNTILFALYYTLIACPKAAITYALHKRTDLVKWVFKALFWNFSHTKHSKDLGFKLL